MEKAGAFREMRLFEKIKKNNSVWSIIIIYFLFWPFTGLTETNDLNTGINSPAFTYPLWQSH